jgi:hypothetical protein
MVRRAFVLACFLACGDGDSNPDATEPPLVWTWSFVDADGTNVGCPANVSNVRLAAYRARQQGECVPYPPQISAQVTLPCALGRGTLDLSPSTTVCDLPNTYSIRVIAETDDSLPYANEGERVSLAPTAIGHTEIAGPRGYIRLTWTMVKKDGVTPTTCPQPLIRTSLTTWLRDEHQCSAGSAVLTGLVPGTYDFDVTVESSSGFSVDGTGHVTGAVVTADAITDVAVTITQRY